MPLFKHYLMLVWRHFSRYKTHTCVNIASLTLGLTCFFVAYAAYLYVNSLDRGIEGADRTYFVYSRGQQLGTNHWFPYAARNSPATYKYMSQDFPEIEVLARSSRIDDLVIQVGANRSYRDLLFAGDSFFGIFTEWNFIAKSHDNPLAMPNSAVVSAAAARRIFGTEEALGRTFMIEGEYDVTITGIVDGLPSDSYAGSSFIEKEWDFLVSIDVFNEIQSKRRGFDLRDTATLDVWNVSPYVLHVRFKEGRLPSIQEFNAKLTQFTERYRPADTGRLELGVEPVTKYMNFVVNQKLLGDARGLSVASVLVILGILVLTVSCLNYSNLAIAQAGSRVKEIGMRKVIGAGRKQVFFQFLTEIACHTIIAAILAFGMILVLIPIVRAQFGIGMDIALLLNWRSLGVLTTVILIVGLAAGVYPSLTLAGVRPAISLQQGKSKMGSKKLISAMSGIQFAVSGFLLISVMLMYVHNLAQRSVFSAGSGEDQVVLLENHVRESGISFDMLRDRLITDPSILSVSGTYDLPFGVSLGAGGYRTVIAESMDESSLHFDIQRKMVNYDYFETLDLEVLYGRVFDREYGGDETPLPSRPEFLTFAGPGRIVVDLDAAKRLTDGNPQRALGMVIYEKDLLDANGEKASMPLEVIGVVANSPYRLVSDSVETELYLLQPPAAVRPLVRVAGNSIGPAISHLDSTWASLGAKQPIRRSFMDQRFERAYAFFDAMGKTFTALALVALLISCSGLVAMTSYIIQKRKNEIAIRKVLGARDKQIFGMLLSEMSRPIVIANLVAWPVAFWAMGQYFSQFVDQPGGMYWVYPVALGASLLIAWTAIGIQVGRTTRIKPAFMLRYQ